MIGLNKKTHTERRTPSWMILPKIWLKLYSIKTKLMIYCVKNYNKQLMTLLEAELTAFLGYDPYARDGWNSPGSYSHWWNTKSRWNQT